MAAHRDSCRLQTACCKLVDCERTVCRTADPKPADLYGKITWKIEKFSEISKRELRSKTFDAGSYKWCARACAA